MSKYLFASGTIRVERRLFTEIDGKFFVFPSDPTRKVYYAKRDESKVISVFQVLADTTILNIKVNVASEDVLVVNARSLGIFEIHFSNAA